MLWYGYLSLLGQVCYRAHANPVFCSDLTFDLQNIWDFESCFVLFLLNRALNSLEFGICYSNLSTCICGENC